jgi:hypothetical protein
MDAIDKEIAELQAGWDRDGEIQKQRRAEAQRKHLEMRRDTLRAGTFKPDCTCAACLRAVLTLRPELICDNGLQRGKDWGMWWVRPGDDPWIPARAEQ